MVSDRNPADIRQMFLIHPLTCTFVIGDMQLLNVLFFFQVDINKVLKTTYNYVFMNMQTAVASQV